MAVELVGGASIPDILHAAAFRLIHSSARRSRVGHVVGNGSGATSFEDGWAEQATQAVNARALILFRHRWPCG